MKKILLGLNLILASYWATAQNGLENVIVERYYISDANDTNMNSVGGVLPIGSVTYRVFLDMLPGYKFQAAYGVNTPGAMHELRIETSTLFFNNEDRGATSPTFTKNQAKNNTVMLDSWLSVGAACNGNFGVLKSEDNGVATNVNADGVLLNADPLAGIPLSSEDGLLAGSPEIVTTVGISNEIAVFDAQNDGTNGPLFSTFNGSWASLNGSIGPDTSNKILIAQITTDGVFSFELNVQLGTPSGGVEQYVAKNPVGAEIQFAGLTYNSALGSKPLSSDKPSLNIYPNPANEFLNIAYKSYNSDAFSTYTIYDLTGKIVERNRIITSNQNAERINISALSKGIYFVEVNSGDYRTTQKFIKL